MACVSSQLIEEVTAHAQRDSFEDAQMVLIFRITYVITDVSGETADTITCFKVTRMSAVSLMDYVTSHPKRLSLGTAM